ncbi:MAG: hypothetical protein B7Y99_02085 [Caulobacterales bacterium 32-69-10]|nr:MAG: hypothetical protein B7Y99_02085 [Caulobacterales bacterium 32-69-10]
MRPGRAFGLVAACAGLLAGLVALGGEIAVAQTGARPIVVQTRPAPLNLERPKDRRVGALVYAGGLILTSPETDRFGGLSGLDVRPDGTFVSHSDSGDLLTGRIVLSRRGRLVGIADATWAKLTDEAGEAFQGAKSNADSEDITFMPGGGFAVSFEQSPRVELYQGEGGARRLGVPAEAASFPSNAGLEALTVWTDAQGRQRLVEGSEDGRAWSCDLEGQGCVQILDPAVDSPDKEFSLTGLDALPDGQGMVAVYRAFDLIKGMRTLVAWFQPDAAKKMTELARISPPYTIDNMEGIAALRNRDGSIRLYLISDDNLNRLQRTVLLAFDWRAPRPQ